MSNTQGSSSHGKLIAVVVAAAVVIILAAVSYTHLTLPTIA